jgi:hypothetical protein
LFDTISVENTNGGVVGAEIFVRLDCDVIIGRIASIVVGLAGKGISVVGGTRFVLQKDVILLSLG